MTDNDNKDRPVRKADMPQKGPESVSKVAASKEAVSKGKNSDPIAQALRNAYQSTIDEGVPDDFLDLIKKLD